MAKNEPLLQALAAQLAEEEQANSDLQAKIADLQKDLADQQMSLPASHPLNQVSDPASPSSQPFVPPQGMLETQPTQVQPQQQGDLSSSSQSFKTSSPAAQPMVSQFRYVYPPQYPGGVGPVPQPIVNQAGYAYSPQPLGRVGPMPQALSNPNPSNEVGSGAALTGMILGAVSLLLSICFGIGILPATLGIIFSLFGRNSPSRKSLATAGLIMSIIAFVLSLGVCVLLSYAYSAMLRSLPPQPTPYQ